MAGPSWLVDSKRIATKIKNASTQGDHRRFKWKSNPTKSCPKCNHIIDNSDVVQEWPGLPQGVKFDPSDQELLWHLLAKVESETAKAHPFIDEFIPTVEEEDGICYTHPQMLPGVKTDGSVSHFFHRTFKAYNTGTRKRRKINGDNFGDVRWHKTGKTKPVIIDGKHLGCKKIMVLYMSTLKGGKPEKTNWVMHQYHLGSGEDEKDGEYVVSKIFHQQQSKPGEKSGQDAMIVVKESNSVQDPIMHLYHHGSGEDERDGEYVVSETIHQQQPNPGDKNGQDTMVVVKESIPVQDHITLSPEHHANDNDKDDIKALDEVCNQEIFYEASTDEFNNHHANKKIDDQDENAPEDNKWWEGESQFLLDSQQLAEGIAICDEFLQSQSSCNGEEVKKTKPRLADYAHMGVENLKRDLEECQKLDNLEHHNIDNEASQDFRLSQLEFGSQDSLLAWVGKELAD